MKRHDKGRISTLNRVTTKNLTRMMSPNNPETVTTIKRSNINFDNVSHQYIQMGRINAGEKVKEDWMKTFSQKAMNNTIMVSSVNLIDNAKPAN